MFDVESLSEDLGRPVRRLECTKGMRADRCGAGAVALSLELLRLHHTNDLAVQRILHVSCSSFYLFFLFFHTRSRLIMRRA